MSIEGATKQNQSLENHENHEQPHLNLEDVVVDVDEARKNCRENPHSDSCNLQLLHNKIDQTEVCDIFREYEEHKILTLGDLSLSVQALAKNLEKDIETLEDDPEEKGDVERKYNLLRERDAEIGKNVRRYVQSIAKFFHIKKQRDRLDPEEFKYKMQDIDQRRRQIHNTLIESMKIYSTLVTELQSDGYLADVQIVPWSAGMVPEGSDDTVYIFSNSVLQNRDLIKDWAISAHLHGSLQRIEEIQKEHANTD